MLKIKNISSGYGKRQVLKNVSLNINPGDVILLTGGNGSGKSTLLKCIYKQLPLWEGEIHYEGINLDKIESSGLIHRGIVYIPQKDFCFENLTVEENLQISGNFLSKEQLFSRISEVLDITGLGKFKNRKPFSLSGGERKILAFGMALIHRPKLLLFDEPFAGVDNKNYDIINGLFENIIITPENGVIIVEHKSISKGFKVHEVKMNLGQILN